MSSQFSFDVFLSYSSKDKAVVRAVAERLRADGLRVWLDDWEIRPGHSIPAKIEDGLERSRVLVLCMSANAFGSGWASAKWSPVPWYAPPTTPPAPTLSPWERARVRALHRRGGPSAGQGIGMSF